ASSTAYPSSPLFLSMTRLPPTSTLFPYTTLFRSPAFTSPRAAREAHRRQGARSPRDPCGGSERARKRRAGPCRRGSVRARGGSRSEEHTSELQSLTNLVCRLLLEKKHTRVRTTRL